MADLDQAVATQLANIEKRSGQTVASLIAIVQASSHTKVSALREMLKHDLGMGHGDANLIVHVAQHGLPGESDTPSADEALDSIYIDSKAALRPIHDAIMAAVLPFGPFEIAPKKANVSLRGKKQFALIGPATKTQVEVGLNATGLTPTKRLVAIKPGGMCNYKVRLGAVSEVDAELIAWLQHAYEASIA